MIAPHLLGMTAVPVRAFRPFLQAPVAVAVAVAWYSSRGSAASRAKSNTVVRTSIDELEPLPDSIRESLTSDSPKLPGYTATGNSMAPEVHSSRPAAPGPSAPDVDPRVAAPGQFNGGSSRPPSGNNSEEWTISFAGLGEKAFSKQVADVLTAPINENDIEIKPGEDQDQDQDAFVSSNIFLITRTRTLADGLIYLPEIKYRRILNRAFGPGGWGMAPRSETNVGQGIVSREWVLICQGR